MTRTLSYTILFLAFLIRAYSQTEIGLNFDADGTPLYGYYDPADYSPKNVLKITHVSGEYEEGYYYTKDLTKISGLIKFRNHRIHYKESEDYEYVVIKPEEIKAFTIGTDSFIVINNFYIFDQIQTRKEFVQFIDTIGDITIVKHFNYKSIIAFDPNTEANYLAKHKDDDIWDNFHKGLRFEKNIKHYFGEIPGLMNKIHNEEYSKEDMPNIVKMAQFYHKYQTKQAVLYDAYWHETRHPNKATFKAYIKNLKDDIWTLEYYKDEQKLYTVNYTSLSPMSKTGVSESYHPNGHIRKSQKYHKNKVINLKIYDREAEEKMYIKNFESDYDLSFYQHYITFQDSIGQNTESVYHDALENKDYVFEFTEHEISECYREDNDKTIYQIVAPNEIKSIDKLQRRLDRFLLLKSYKKALEENVDGYILLKVKVNHLGEVIEYYLLNNLHKELDQIVLNFADTYFNYSNKPNFKFKALKDKNPNILHEFVIPFKFTIKRKYRIDANPYNYNHWYFYDHDWLQHQPLDLPIYIPKGPTGY